MVTKMKCDYCGGLLSLEDEKCPHCGRPNEHARKHIEDMRRYEGEFEKTKKYVYEKTGIYTQIAVRTVILAILVILSVGLFVLNDNAYSITRDLARSSAEKKYGEYSQIMDGYLAEENFVAFSSFCEAHSLSSYEGAYAPKYWQVIPTATFYVQVMDELYQYAFPGSYTLDQLPEWTADTMKYFYKNLEDAYVAYSAETVDDPAIAEALDAMEETVKRFLVTYCGFTEEEAEAMHNMSDARRQLLLEEKWEDMQSNEQ